MATALLEKQDVEKPEVKSGEAEICSVSLDSRTFLPGG